MVRNEYHNAVINTRGQINNDICTSTGIESSIFTLQEVTLNIVSRFHNGDINMPIPYKSKTKM